MFTNINTGTLLADLGIRRVVLYGVVAEICVAAAVNGLLGRNYSVTVVEDAIRYLDLQKAQTFLNELCNREVARSRLIRCWIRVSTAA